MKKSAKKRFITWFTVAGLQFMLNVIRIFPSKIVYPFGNALSVLYYILARKNRLTALSNIEKALWAEKTAEQRVQIVKESFTTMSHIILDTLCFGDISDAKAQNNIEIDGLENLEKALSKGKGVIAVSAHLGSFTIMGGGLASRGYKASFVARHARNKGVEAIIMRLCRKSGQKIIFSQPVHTCMRQCIAALKRNEVVIIEMDQNFGTEGIEVKFFNQSANVASGPVKLAISTQAAVVPMFIIRINAFKHVIKIDPVIEFVQNEDEQIQVRDNLQKVCAVVEKYIRKYPGQWVNWIHKKWAI